MYFDVAVTLELESTKGKVKNVKENYLVEAETITHAEAQVHKDFLDTGITFKAVAAKESKIIKVIPLS